MSDHRKPLLPFERSVAISSSVLTIAIVMALVMPTEAARGGTLTDRIVAKFNTMRFVTVTRGQAERQMEGYYEGLFQHAGKAVSVNSLVSGQWAADWAAWHSIQLRQETTRHTGDFLYYELRPNLDVAEVPGRLVTNSFGMADREYPTERRPGYRRVAYIGDSMARGLGSNPGANYESLLEGYLDEGRPAGDSIGFESLNFGVEGYRITQMVEVARSKAALFSPDVYILVLSDLSVSRKWSDHIGQLVADGIDLRFDFLKDVVGRARVRPDDDAVTIEAKLEPYRMDVLRWALQEVQDLATSQNGQVMVMLIPTVSDPRLAANWFEGVPELVESLGIPLLDLLDAFEGIDDLAPYRIAVYDAHPTDQGHRHLFDHLVGKLEERPELRAVLTGEGSD